MAFLKAFSSLDHESVPVSYGFVRVTAEGYLVDSDLHSQCLLLGLVALGELTLNASLLPCFPCVLHQRPNGRSPTRTFACGSSVILAFLILYIQIILHQI